jgi:hypothetical protein
VIEHRPLVDVHGIAVEAALESVRAKGAEADSQGQGDGADSGEAH